MNGLISLFASMVMALYGLYNYGQDGNKHVVDSVSSYHNHEWMENNDKWIIMTAITDSVHDVIGLNRTTAKGWTILLVGERESTPDWAHTIDNLIYLSRSGQKNLGFNVESLLPRDLQTRGIVGYLYAISRGARVIYESTGGNQTKIPVENFILKPNWTGLMYDGSDVFNPYKHFGQGKVLPRGFPDGFETHNVHSYLLGNWETASIQQTLVENYLGEKAVLKNHRNARENPPNRTFDLRAPSVSVPKGVFSPFDATSTLFRYDAFWAMFLPVTTPRSVSDLYRSYWAQRLLWEIGGTVGFFTTGVIHGSKETAFKGVRFQSRAHFKAHELIDFLNRWTCNQRESFFNCVLMLAGEMADQTFWGHSEVDLIRFWIKDLKVAGYAEPKRIKFSKTPRRKRKLYRLHHERATKLRFVPEVQIAGSGNGSMKIFSRQTEKASLICPNLHIRMNSVHPKLLNSILLIVTISDRKNYESIATFEALYSLHFPHVLYCGGKMRAFLKISKDLKYPVTFVEADLKRGTMRQKCLIKAMEMNYKVEGYLFVSDKALINPWTFFHLPVHRFWFMKPVTQLHEDTTHRGKQRSRNKNKAFQRSMKEMESANKTRYLSFKEHLQENTKRDYTGYLTMVSDIVFIPQKYQQGVLFYLNIFTSNGMVSDHALATTIGGMANLKEVHFLDGHYTTTSGRGSHTRHFQQDFHKNFNYLFPVDFRKTKKSTDTNNFVCNTLLPLVFGTY